MLAKKSEVNLTDCCNNKKVSQKVASVMKRFQGQQLISQQY
jgi:hypothetical protein